MQYLFEIRMLQLIWAPQWNDEFEKSALIYFEFYWFTDNQNDPFQVELFDKYKINKEKAQQLRYVIQSIQ